jgi:predicted nucleic acid-binding protein
MGWAILDTSIYIDHWESGKHDAQLSEVRRGFVIRHSAVVLSELRRGARSLRARRVVEALRSLAPVIWEPMSEDWWIAGGLIRKIGDAQGWDTRKRREFQNDALIALSARRHGATVITANGTDFRLLAREIKFAMVAFDLA